MAEGEEQPALTGPRIHLNGTSRQALSEGYERAGVLLQEAIVALGETSPNARDYYPLGPGAYHRAVGEHAHRVARLRAVQGELYWLLESLDEGENAPRPEGEKHLARHVYVPVDERELPKGLRWDVTDKGQMSEQAYADDPPRTQPAGSGSPYRRMRVYCDGNVSYWRRVRG